MSCSPLPKAVKLVVAFHLARLLCFVVLAKCQNFVSNSVLARLYVGKLLILLRICLSPTIETFFSANNSLNFEVY